MRYLRLSLILLASLSLASAAPAAGRRSLQAQSAVGPAPAVLKLEAKPKTLQLTSPGTPPRPLSYIRDVFPILSKAGCSQGVCHGNASGKGGLKLSLRGQDAAADYEALVRYGGGRRINRVDPSQSLMLLKPSGGLPHSGGVRFSTSSPEYRSLSRWIAEGAISDAATAPAVVRLTVFPPERVLYARHGPRGKGSAAPSGTRQQLRVTARFADGSEQNVTRLACYESSDPKVSITPNGLVEAPAGGEAGINVRYGGKMETSRLAFVPVRPKFAFRPFPVRNSIDLHVLSKLRTLRIQPSPLCDDSTFLRRAYLDALGFPPTPEEARAFLTECAAERRSYGGMEVREYGSGAGATTLPHAHTSTLPHLPTPTLPHPHTSAPQAPGPPAFRTRAKLIEQLTQRPEFADFWTMKWADLLRAEERSLDPEGMQALYGWLRAGFRENKPLDRFVRELLTATGDTYDHPATAFYRRTRSPDELAETTAQLFMGVRVGCAKCHNHPYDRWKQADYHSMAAYFARVERETKFKPRRQRYDAKEINGDEILVVKSAGEWKNPSTEQPAPPVMLGDAGSVPAADADRRQALADWLTRPDNPFFARAMVNRVWYHIMGRGIVEPVDDFRDSNPPSNIPLLDTLARDFAAGGFDLRRLVATIMESSTYQLSSASTPLNAADVKYFSHVVPSRLTAEQMLEAIGNETGAAESYTGYAPGTHVTGVVPTWKPNPFLRLFGQPPRETVCECERSEDATLGQSFELIGGRLIDSRLRQADNRLSRLLASDRAPGELVEELYLAAYARYPSADERKAALAYLEKAKDTRAGLEDLSWGLMNTKEFLLRH